MEFPKQDPFVILVSACGLRRLCFCYRSNVIVEDLNANPIEDGLTIQQLRTDVELRLRKAGVRVADDPSQSKPFLYVNVNAIKSKDGRYAYYLDVAFHQPAIAVSNGLKSFMSTWSVGSVGIVGSQEMSMTIRDKIGDHVDQFINAWLSVNPK